jgi:hypothetical protein
MILVLIQWVKLLNFVEEKVAIVEKVVFKIKNHKNLIVNVIIMISKFLRIPIKQIVSYLL